MIHQWANRWDVKYLMYYRMISSYLRSLLMILSGFVNIIVVFGIHEEKTQFHLVSIPCDTLWCYLFFFILSMGLQTCILMWHRSIWDRMPFQTPPWSAGNLTQDLLFGRPMQYPLHNGHSWCVNMDINYILHWHQSMLKFIKFPQTANLRVWASIH